ATIERYLGYWRRLLEAMAADDRQPIDGLPLLSAAERDRVLHEFNATAADYPRESCVHELFEAQVAKAPEAIAVVYEDEHLTYGGLNARANRLGLHLPGIGGWPRPPGGGCAVAP